MRFKSVLILLCVTLISGFMTPTRSTAVGQQGGKAAANSKLAVKTKVTNEKKVAGKTMVEWKADLSSSNEIIRLRAVKSLGPFGTDAITILNDCLSDESDAVQYWAADHLGTIGAEVAESKNRAGVIESLRRIIKSSPDKAVSMAAAYAHFKIDSSAEHLELIIRRLSHRERGMACSAAEFLGKIGPPAKAALPELQSKYKDHGDYHVRGASLNAIRKIKGEPVR